jgi:hypothetical protein
MIHCTSIRASPSYCFSQLLGGKWCVGHLLIPRTWPSVWHIGGTQEMEMEEFLKGSPIYFDTLFMYNVCFYLVMLLCLLKHCIASVTTAWNLKVVRSLKSLFGLTFFAPGGEKKN